VATTHVVLLRSPPVWPLIATQMIQMEQRCPPMTLNSMKILAHKLKTDRQQPLRQALNHLRAQRPARQLYPLVFHALWDCFLQDFVPTLQQKNHEDLGYEKHHL
jgi:hypothetical protein